MSSLGVLWPVKTSGVLAANVAYVFQYLCGLWVVSTCLISRIPSMEWPSVRQTFSAKVGGWNQEPRGGGAAVGEMLGGL